jgi:hypothetical protein
MTTRARTLATLYSDMDWPDDLQPSRVTMRGRRAIAEAERTIGMDDGASGCTVTARRERGSLTTTITRKAYDDEGREPAAQTHESDPSHEQSVANLDSWLAHDAKLAVGEAHRHWKRCKAWRDTGAETTPLWAYDIHPVHRALVMSMLPNAEELDARVTGMHRHMLQAMRREHGDNTEQRKSATLVHVEGVIAIERAALTAGGVPIEIGTTNRQIWVRLVGTNLPQTMREALVGGPIGRVLETGDADADATSIETIVSGVRGDRIVLDGRLVPLAPPPEGADGSWRRTRYEHAEPAIAEAGRG